MITDFLQTKIERAQIAAALKVVREFKGCESQEEYLAIPFDAWAKLEQLEEFLAHLVEGQQLRPDTLNYIAQHPPKDPPAAAARMIDNVTECFIYANTGIVNTCKRGEANTTLTRTTAEVELQVGQRMVIERGTDAMTLEVLPP